MTKHESHGGEHKKEASHSKKEHAHKHAEHKTQHKEHKTESTSAHTTEHKKKTSHSHHVPTPASQGYWNPVTIALTVIIILLVGYLIVDKIDFGSGSAAAPIAAAGSQGQELNADGKIVITEYSDFECPFCARALPTVEQIKAKYGDEVVIEYKHFPLNFHANAAKAAEASECARDQGQFWAYHDLLFENQNALTVPSLKTYAGQLGLDQAAFDSCLDSGEKKAIVDQHLAEGRQAGVTGTPTFIVGGEKIVGAQPLSAFESAIANAGANVAPAGPDPDITLTIINDATCGVCDASQIKEVLTGTYFPTTTVTELDISDAQAQDFIEQYDITAVPAFIFDSNVAQAARFSEVSQAFIATGGAYVVSPAAVGNVKTIAEPNIEGRPMQGDVDAPILIVEYSDFECPFCARFYNDAYQQLITEYVDTGKAKIVYKHFPLSFHANAKPAAEASECAFEQGKFWEFHDLIFENQQSLNRANYITWAGDIGLDVDQFTTCFDEGRYADIVDQDFAEGQQDGVSGTPGFLVGGISVSGAQPFANFESIIEGLLAN